MNEVAVILLKAWQAYDLLEDMAMELDTDIDELLEDIAAVKAGSKAMDDLVQETVERRDAAIANM